MAFCNKRCSCGHDCGRHDDHGGGCDCYDPDCKQSAVYKSSIVGTAIGKGPGTVQFMDGTVATIAPATITDGNGKSVPLKEAFDAAIEKVERTKTPFMRACDDLVEALTAAEKLFVERFRLPGEVAFMDKLKLAYRKRGDRRGLWVISADGNTFTPLMACNAEWRSEAAKHLPDLWEACSASDSEALSKVLRATSAVKEFLSNLQGSSWEPE